MNALKELNEKLHPDEPVNAIVFGEWGWNGYNEPETLALPIPEEYKKTVLSLSQAEPFLKEFSFSGGFGSPDCYAVYIWTDRRVFFITEYDGSTSLCYVPLVSRPCDPEMFGG